MPGAWPAAALTYRDIQTVRERKEHGMAQQWTEGLDTASRRGAPVRGGVVVVGVALTPDEAKRVRTRLLVAGFLSILGGVAAIAVPAIASVTIAIFIGWMLIFTGIVMAIDAFSQRERGRMALRALNAVLAIGVGLYLIVAPLSGTLTLTFMLAAWFFATGALLLAGAWQLRRIGGASLMALNGTLSLVLGLLIAVDLPSSADWAIGLLVGINLLFWGIRALVAAAALQHAYDE
ncbi:MAG TPA: DUF308 domain-containing protein [Solirubrobacteraceae bacterium]